VALEGRVGDKAPWTWLMEEGVSMDECERKQLFKEAWMVLN